MIRAMASAARVFVDKRSLLIIPMLFYFGVIASTILADYSTVSCDLTANIFSQGHSLYFLHLFSSMVVWGKEFWVWGF